MPGRDTAGVATDWAVEARGVVYRYGGPAGHRPGAARAGRETALAGADLTVRAGALCALIGANGAGKTTLLRIVAGFLKPSAGTVRVLGVEGPAQGDRQLRQRLGYVSQEPALDPEMTAGETLKLLGALYSLTGSARAERIRALTQTFDLGPLTRRISTLSGGQRRRLHLAAGLLHDPELLCLDEPATGLDPDGRAALWAELARRSENGRTTLLVSHDLAAVERQASAVGVVDRGVVVAAGAPSELAQDSPGLAETYHRLTGRSPVELEEPAARSRRGR